MIDFALLKKGLTLLSNDTSLGQECYNNIVKTLSNLLEAEYAFIGIYKENSSNEIETIAMSENGEIVPNIHYFLHGTPCANVVNKSICIYENEVDRLFPDDLMLTEMNINGYLGAPIFNLQNKPIGLLALMSKRPLKDSPETRSLVQVCAARAGAEIERTFYEARLKKVNQDLEEQVHIRLEQLKNLKLIQKEKELEYAERVAKLGRWKWDVVNDKVEWSEVLKEIFGLKPTDTVPSFSEFQKIHTKESFERLKECVNNALTNGEPYQIDLEIYTPAGITKWIQGRGEVTERDAQGKVIQLAGTVQDIDDRKRLENNLHKALEVRDVFLGVASHELKTPLTTLQLQINSLIKLFSGNLENVSLEKVRTRLLAIKRQGDRFEQLVKTLLDVSRINAGKLRPRIIPDTNLSAILEEVTARFSDEFMNVGSPFKVNIQKDVIGDWDPQGLDQVISNLLTNAIKYGGGNEVIVTLTCDGKTALIEVKDHGIGIAKEVQDKIFERFERAVDEHNFKGFGLGLWIVKEILCQFDGSITVESELGKGSCFKVMLPLKPGTT